MSSITPEEFKQGMRHLAAAVNVVSAMVDGEPRGMLATAVCSVSAEPPTLLVCVNRDTSMHGTISDTGAFCVSVLNERQFDAALRFISKKGPERFALCEWDILETGAPAIRDAIVNFDAKVKSTVEVGTHTIFLGHVVGLRVFESNLPLIYHDGSFAALKD